MLVTQDCGPGRASGEAVGLLLLHWNRCRALTNVMEVGLGRRVWQESHLISRVCQARARAGWALTFVGAARAVLCE
ncbi:hypothetical protein MPL3356_350056 [Mesorhizobium plurifarium]|uniref:Uncharacterized protein n=1 Tax=Mesorhizobium plurifarium TaxID=69974 RepID=A0A090E2N7_MESPL|nr:hypothetical protein MPL3356_350056 [Mesorhizobium plurifarium]